MVPVGMVSTIDPLVVTFQSPMLTAEPLVLYS
jgi:hypothetical protein